MQKQRNVYFENILSIYQCGFGKDSAQLCLISMIEKLLDTLDKGGIIAALLTDLSKTFDYLSHDLLIAKLHGYGIELSSSRLRKQSSIEQQLLQHVLRNFAWGSTKIYPWAFIIQYVMRFLFVYIKF